MNATNYVDDACRIMRQVLIEQTQLSPDRVLNALSLRGTELDVMLSEEDQIYNTITIGNTTLLFEWRAINSSSDTSMEEGDIYTARDLVCGRTILCSDDIVCGDFVIDRSITYYKMYQLYIIIYGDDSSDLAIKLAARLRSQEVRAKLYTQGIYLEKVSNPVVVNEFKNDTMWLRNDLNVDIGLKFMIAQTSRPQEYKEINDMNIIRREDYE